jgi:hypothetical protein
MFDKKFTSDLIEKIVISEFPEQYSAFLFEKDTLIDNFDIEVSKDGGMLNAFPSVAELTAVQDILKYVALTGATLLVLKEITEKYNKVKDWIFKDKEEEQKKIKSEWTKYLISYGMKQQKAELISELFYKDIADKIK